MPAAALCSGRLRRFSAPVPILLLPTKLDVVPFFTKLVDVFFLTKLEVPLLTLLALPTDLWVRVCTLREGARCTLRVVTLRPLVAASAGVASNSVRATTAAAAADTSIVVLMCFLPVSACN